MPMNQKVCSWIITAGLIAQVAWGQAAAKPAAAPAAALAVATNATAATTNQAATGPAPKIQFNTTVYDFGSTSAVQQLAGKFIISNTGSGTLEIKKPQPSCGCTVPALTKDKLAPGESTELTFTLNVSTPRGHLEKHITVPSNDPTQPTANLTLKADIVPTFDVTPPNVNLGNIHQGQTTSVVVQVKRLDSKPFGLVKAEASLKNIRPKLGPVDSSNAVAQLTIEIEADGSPRPLNDTVRVFGADATVPAFTVPILGRIVGDVTASPEAQFWGIADAENWPSGHPEQAVRKFMLVCTKTGANFEIKKATTELADVTVEVKPVEVGKSYEVIATLAKAPKQSARGSIKVETNIDSQPTIDLGLTINVLKRN
jgi:hypothetical protein